MPKAIRKNKELKNYVPNNNAMSGIFDIPGLGGMIGIGGGQPFGANLNGGRGGINHLSEPLELIYSESYYLLSLLRTVLTYAYTIHGPLRKVVNTPVYDAFRGGIKIKTDEADAEEIDKLHRGMKERKLEHKVQDAMRWNRLYGGSGIIINLNQNYQTPLQTQNINEESLLEYIVADRWQLTWKGIPNDPNAMLAYSPTGNYVSADDYINNLHSSRVARIVGEEAPALVRGRLAGWGMSVLEPIIRPLNLYIKEENALFEYIDQFKIDVMKVKGFNSHTLSKAAVGVVSMRLRLALWIKNMLNAIVMDSEDDFEQKQIQLSGLATVMEQIRINIACSCDMPLSKLFGLAASGFDSGESDLEVYNSMVENEREKAERILEILIPIEMQKTWGFVPDSWEIEWKKLRVLSEVEQEAVNTSKQNRVMELAQAGIYDPQETCDALKAEGLLTVQTKVADGAEPDQWLAGMGMEDDSELPEPAAKKKPSSGKRAKE
jgi:uncharacterized protein